MTTRDQVPDLPLARSPLARWTYLGLGWFFVLLGIIGAALPIMPTTCFLILAGGCFAHSSKRCYNWLVNQRWLGPPIRNWRERGCMSRKAKSLAIGAIALSFGSTIGFGVAQFWLQVLLVALAVGLIGYLLRIPSHPVSEA